MSINTMEHLDNFCSGHLIVNKDRNIIFYNSYINNLNDKPIDKLNSFPLSSCFTKASNIFIDSYIYPLLLNKSIVQECQMSWIDNNGKTTPVVVNIKLGDNGTSFWSLYVCTNRDKLHSELIKAKEQLEAQSKELYQLAITDPLTSLINRRELQIQTQKIINHTARNSSSFALLAIDIDFFKDVNDTYGHQAGDKVLTSLANILKEDRRANDLVARIGGEEFILVLPDIDEENAYTLAEKIRLSVENHMVDNIKITISIGLIVSGKDKQLNFNTLLNLSDKALYHSKKSGRNKTTTAQH